MRARIPQSGTVTNFARFNVRDIASPAERGKPVRAIGPEDAHRMRHTIETGFDVEGELPAEEAENRVFRAGLLGAGRQRAHHFFVHSRGIAQRKLASASP